MSDRYGCKKCGTNWTSSEPIVRCPDCDPPIPVSDYTWTTEEVAETFARGIYYMSGQDSPIFREWLAAHDAEVREEAANDAWKEGFDAGFADHKEGYDAGYAKGCADEREKAVSEIQGIIVGIDAMLAEVHTYLNPESQLATVTSRLRDRLDRWVAAARGDGAE